MHSTCQGIRGSKLSRLLIPHQALNLRLEDGRNLVAVNMYSILNSWKFVAAKLKGFTVNRTAQWFTVVAKSLVLPEILSVLSVQAQCFVVIPISISVEICHALASNYLGTVGVLAACHSKLFPPGTRFVAAPWASPRGGAGKVRVTWRIVVHLLCCFWVPAQCAKQ